MSVALAVPGDAAVAAPIPITVEQGRAVILTKMRAIDARHRDITSHTVSNCHRNVSRQIVLCQVRFTHADGEVCSGHAEVGKTRSGDRTSYVYRGYGFRCRR